jgi:hypothetical protein
MMIFGIRRRLLIAYRKFRGNFLRKNVCNCNCIYIYIYIRATESKTCMTIYMESTTLSASSSSILRCRGSDASRQITCRVKYTTSSCRSPLFHNIYSDTYCKLRKLAVVDSRRSFPALDRRCWHTADIRRLRRGNTPADRQH